MNDLEVMIDIFSKGNNTIRKEKTENGHVIFLNHETQVEFNLNGDYKTIGCIEKWEDR